MMEPNEMTREHFETMKKWVWDTYEHTHPDFEEKIQFLFARMYELGWNAAVAQMEGRRP